MGSKQKKLPPGTLVAGYQIERELGHGSMAVVYLATQLNLQRPVAVKVLADALAQDHDFIVRFFNEAKAAGALTHPHIVQAYDAGCAKDGIYYFVMEYVEGENLEERITREGVLPYEEAMTMGADIAHALEYGWKRKGLTHGDIKPENIMVNDDGETKLADFGLAKVRGRNWQDTESLGIMLTPAYAPPERIQGKHKEGDCRGDIYSFGASLYHMLVGVPPYPGDDAQFVMDQHVKAPLIPAGKRNPTLPRKTSDFLSSLLEKSPEARPSSWEDVTKHLEELQSTKHAKGTPKPKRRKKMVRPPKPTVHPHPHREKKKYHGVFLTFLLLLLATIAAVVYIRVKRQRGEPIALPFVAAKPPPPAPPKVSNGTKAPQQPKQAASTAPAPETAIKPPRKVSPKTVTPPPKKPRAAVAKPVAAHTEPEARAREKGMQLGK